MTRRFGSQTVTVVSVTENSTVRDRYKNPEKVRTETPVPGCRFRPLPAREVSDLGEKVADPWKLTAPPVPAVMNAKNTDELKHNGITYQLIGVPRVFSDLSGRPHHVTILAERQLG